LALWSIILVGVRFKKFFGPNIANYQLWFWSTALSFFFYLAPFGAFLPFLGPSGYYLGWRQVPKIFWDLTMQTINFGFGSTALSFFIMAHLEPFLAL